MMTTQKKIAEKMAELKSQINEWNESESRDEYLEIDIFETVQEIFETLEADEGFIAPKECQAQDVGRDNPDYIEAVAEHAEELADTLDNKDDSDALNFLAYSWKKNAHTVGGSDASRRTFLSELAETFNLE